MVFPFLLAFYADRAEGTCFDTCTTLDALSGVDNKRCLDLAGNGAGRTAARALGASLTLVGIDLVDLHGLAYAGTALLVEDVLLIFLAECLDGTDNRLGSTLTQTTQGALPSPPLPSHSHDRLGGYRT